jgi:hypothetical protein
MNINEEALAFYWRLGMAITQWAHVEHSLFEVLAVVERDRTELESFWKLSRYGQFRQQLQLTNGSLQAEVTDSGKLDLWRSVQHRLARGYRKRNKLAHRVVMNYPHAAEGRRKVLIDFSSPLAADPPADALGVRNIVAYADEFASLHHTLSNLRCILQGKPAALVRTSPVLIG